MEVVVVITIVMISLSWTVPRYTVAVEQSRVDLAGSNLLMIWTAQRLYWVSHSVYATTIQALVTEKLLDATFVATGGPDSKYTYTVTAADSSTFSASGTRVTGDRWEGSLTIDQSGSLSGQITDGAAQNPIVLTPSKYALGM